MDCYDCIDYADGARVRECWWWLGVKIEAKDVLVKGLGWLYQAAWTSVGVLAVSWFVTKWIHFYQGHIFSSAQLFSHNSCYAITTSIQNRLLTEPIRFRTSL